MTLHGKVAVSTGATGGIRATAGRLFAAEGARIEVGCNSRTDAADVLAAELRMAMVRCRSSRSGSR